MEKIIAKGRPLAEKEVLATNQSKFLFHKWKKANILWSQIWLGWSESWIGAVERVWLAGADRQGKLAAMAGDGEAGDYDGKSSPSSASDGTNSTGMTGMVRSAGSEDDADRAAGNGADGGSGSGGSNGAPSSRRSSPEVRFEDEVNKTKGGDSTPPATGTVTADPAASIITASKVSNSIAKRDSKLEASSGDKNQLNSLLVHTLTSLVPPRPYLHLLPWNVASRILSRPRITDTFAKMPASIREPIRMDRPRHTICSMQGVPSVADRPRAVHRTGSDRTGPDQRPLPR